MIPANAGAAADVPPTPVKFCVAGVTLVAKLHAAPFGLASDWQIM